MKILAHTLLGWLNIPIRVLWGLCALCWILSLIYWLFTRSHHAHDELFGFGVWGAGLYAVSVGIEALRRRLLAAPVRPRQSA